MPRVTGVQRKPHTMQVPDVVWQRARELDPMRRDTASYYLRELLIQVVTERWEQLHQRRHDDNGTEQRLLSVEPVQDYEEPDPQEEARPEILYTIRRERRAELRGMDRWSMSVGQYQEVVATSTHSEVILSLRNHDNREVYLIRWSEVVDDQDVVEEFYHGQLFYLIHAGWAWQNKKPGVIKCQP